MPTYYVKREDLADPSRDWLDVDVNKTNRGFQLDPFDRLFYWGKAAAKTVASLPPLLQAKLATMVSGERARCCWDGSRFVVVTDKPEKFACPVERAG